MSNAIAISSKEYSAGDIIITCYPVLYCVKYEYRGKCCDFCLKFNDSLKHCAKCKKLNYCDLKCQKNDWSSHKLECNILAKHKLMNFEKQGFDYMQRLVLRLYLMIISKPDLLHQKFELHNGLNRSIDQMKSHSEEIRPTKQFEGIINYFKFYEIDYDFDFLLKLYGILHINAFGIDIYDENQGISHCASGLYIEGSVFDHWCAPNACASGEGLVLEIRAMKNISVGEEIFIDYIQNILPKSERHSILSERYFFDCKCFRCESNFDQSINYEEFKTLDKDSENSNSESVDYKKRYMNFEERYKIFKAFYPHFHPSLTYFLFIFLRIKLNLKNKLKLNRNDLKKFITEVDNNMKVTHGIDHSFYKMFISLIQNYNFKV